jgi:glycosyltransferase involved in cell wall biosynthesis
MTFLAAACLCCALIPCLVFLRNLRLYRTPDEASDPFPSIAVLIPARNEAANIEAAAASVLRQDYPDFSLTVLDDHSTDGTGDAVLAIGDPRVHLMKGAELPPGWCGKNHALDQLARQSPAPWILFMDADVRLLPGALRRIASLTHGKAMLSSGVPRQITRGFAESLIIPLIHFVLLGFLPFRRMRASTDPAATAAVGQLMLAHRETYLATGGHAAVAHAIHDGMALARNFRTAGHHTDLFDATNLATCRMYERAADVWRGFVKNAAEGLGSPRLIIPVTVMLGLGQVAPAILRFTHAHQPTVAFLAAWALLLSFLTRAAAAIRFRQPWLSVLLHPLGILALLVIQWEGLARKLLNRPVGWRGRTYS